MNPFTVLNMEPSDDKMAIRRAYVREMKLHHPDQGGEAEQVQLIQAAYNQLIAQALAMNVTVIETDMVMSLNDLLTGCIATAVIKTGIHKGTAFEFRVPPMTYPGTVIEFNDSLTNKKICVKLKELITTEYTRLDESIVIKHTINTLEAELGTSIEVINFNNLTYNVTVSPGTTADRLIYNFTGDGFYDKQSHIRGNLTIIVEVDKKRYLNV
jgi:DnaJ-class molecular chaperone